MVLNLALISNQLSFLVPLKGGREHIITPLATHHVNWVIIYHRSHLLREPETAIDLLTNVHIQTTQILDWFVRCLENILQMVLKNDDLP